jgi:hypothetical protein
VPACYLSDLERARIEDFPSLALKGLKCYFLIFCKSRSISVALKYTLKAIW